MGSVEARYVEEAGRESSNAQPAQNHQHPGRQARRQACVVMGRHGKARVRKYGHITGTAGREVRQSNARSSHRPSTEEIEEETPYMHGNARQAQCVVRQAERRHELSLPVTGRQGSGSPRSQPKSCLLIPHVPLSSLLSLLTVGKKGEPCLEVLGKEEPSHKAVQEYNNGHMKEW